MMRYVAAIVILLVVLAVFGPTILNAGRNIGKQMKAQWKDKTDDDTPGDDDRPAD